MLDKFLEAAYEHQQRTSLRNEMAEGFKHLPIEELAKIASGELKLASYDEGDWLEKFKGSPLYDQALALEEECLRIDIAEQQHRGQEQSMSQQLWNAKDSIRLKKRMLELQLRQSEAAPMPAPEGPATEPAAPATGPAPSAMEGAPAGAPMEGGAPKTAAQKIAAKTGMRQGVDVAKKAVEELAGKATKVKASCGMKTADAKQIGKMIEETLATAGKSKPAENVVTKAKGIVHATSPFGTTRVASGEGEDKTAAGPAGAGGAMAGLGTMMGAVPLSLLLGGGLGAAQAPSGKGLEGAARGGIGAWGGGALGGLAGGLGGGLLGGGLGLLTGGKQRLEAAALAGMLGAGLGAIPGSIIGSVKGYKGMMRPLKEEAELERQVRHAKLQRELEGAKESSVNQDIIASMRMAAFAKEANISEEALHGIGKLYEAAKTLWGGAKTVAGNVAQAAKPMTEAAGRAAGSVGETIGNVAGNVKPVVSAIGEHGGNVGRGVAEGLSGHLQGAKNVANELSNAAWMAQHGHPELLSSAAGHAAGAAMPYLGTGAVGAALGHHIGHAAGMEAGRAAMQPEMQKRLLLGLGGGALAGGGLTAAAMGGRGGEPGKTASAELNALAVADIWGREMAQMEKDAFLAALKPVAQAAWQGVKGAGGFLRRGASNVSGAFGAGKGALGTTLKEHGAEALSKATQWAAKNQGAAAGLAGAGLLGAGAAGHMMGSR